ncbi:MAG: hypothetical protein M3N30_07450 [Bacteroidota bacterium]|nr:hypothetical protein [Bacteroidota bacterium]
MKKIIYAILIGLPALLVSGSSTFAQNDFAYNSLINDKNLKDNVLEIASKNSLTHIGANVPDIKNISTKALKDFQGRFDHISNAMWYSDNNGYEAYFLKDGFGSRVFYDKKGKWTYSLIFYDEYKLPLDLRAAIRSTYWDMSIRIVEEVQNPDDKAYVVMLEGKSNIKVLKINPEGEVKILQDLSKE